MPRTALTALVLLLVAGAVFAQETAKDVERTVDDAIETHQGTQAEVERLEQMQRDLESTLARLDREETGGKARLEQLEESWNQSELEFREISGNVRLAARDLLTAIEQSPLTGLRPDRLDPIRPILRQGYFPDIDDISAMVDLAFEEAALSGQVALCDAAYVGRDGVETTGKVLTLGRFTTVYQDGDEVGFLRYAPESSQYFALSVLPGGGAGRTLTKYLAGESESMIIDLSGGSALRQVTHQQSLTDQLVAGGPLVWPMGAIALVALILIVSKFWTLNKVGRSAGKHMTRVNELASQGNWDECEAIVQRHKGEHSPVNHVIEADRFGKALSSEAPRWYRTEPCP